jgi:hypothetical protein
MLRVISLYTNDELGLIEEEEIQGSDQLKEILVQIQLAKFYDDSKPRPPKGMNDYESGMVYPIDRFILKNDSMYKSNKVTATTWVESEWDLKITGANQV